MIFQNWKRFWFESGDPFRLGLFRAIVGLTLSYLVFARFGNINELNAQSVFPKGSVLLPELYEPLIRLDFWPDSIATQMHWLLFCLLLMLTLGLANRFLTFLCWLIYIGFIHRNFAILFGADYIGGIYLFYLMFTQHSERVTVKPYLAKIARKLGLQIGEFKKSRPISFASFTFTSLGYRFLQIQVCTIYVYTGWEKLKGQTWWDGTALWTVLMNTQLAVIDLEFLSQMPMIIPLMTLVTLVFEIYFPVALMIPRLREPWLLMGLFFHLTIGFILYLMPFSLIMVASYVLFSKSAFIDRLKGRFSVSD